MPAAVAQYDIQFNDGSGIAVGGGPRWEAVILMAQERLPDEWGDPGQLLWSELVAWRCAYAREIKYSPCGERMALWIDGCPRTAKAMRTYVRWADQDGDPPPHDDPEWIIPP